MSGFRKTKNRTNYRYLLAIKSAQRDLCKAMTNMYEDKEAAAQIMADCSNNGFDAIEMMRDEAKLATPKDRSLVVTRMARSSDSSP